MLRSVFFKSLLVFALLLTQQGGLTHAISHTLAERQDQSQPHDQQCELCAVYAQVGSALGSNAIHFDFASSFTEKLSGLSVSFRSLAFTAFAARAPPFFA